MNIKQVSLDEFKEWWIDSEEISRFEHAGMIVTTVRHLEMGELTMVSGNHDGGLIIYPS